jgi:hypothetical protein
MKGDSTFFGSREMSPQEQIALLRKELANVHMELAVARREMELLRQEPGRVLATAGAGPPSIAEAMGEEPSPS